MTQTSNQPQKTTPVSMAKPMIIGAAIGFILISLFVFGVDNPNPEWGKYWMIRPLIMVPAAGAVGGLFFYFMMYMSATAKINKTVAFIISFIVFIVGLWMGTVLGLVGTMWD